MMKDSTSHLYIIGSLPSLNMIRLYAVIQLEIHHLELLRRYPLEMQS